MSERGRPHRAPSTLYPGLGPLKELPEGTPVAYFGPENTNTHAAALLLFGQRASLNPELTKAGVFEAVSSGRSRFGIVPIENSTEGVVRETIDCLIERNPVIVSEFEMRIEHYLMAQPGWETRPHRRIVSHPQALGQCRKWLEEAQLPTATATSTASAAELASRDRNVAAIASRLAADAFSLEILSENIADRKDNATRFISIGSEDEAPSGRDKTTLVLSAPHERGALLRLLNVLDAAGVNLTRIESRPLADRKWEYAFVLDVEGHRAIPPLRPALHELAAMGSLVRVAGSYQHLTAPKE